MKPLALTLLLILAPLLHAQATSSPDDAAPTFRVPARQLSAHPVVIAYGDQRFHDPHDPRNAFIGDPVARLGLVNKIAAEHPDALQISGDVPYRGSDPADYDVYRSETAPWRAEHLRVYSALGNHELAGGAEKGLADWYAAFPELTGHRWYSVALGNRLSLIQLDSLSDLPPDSPQINWLRTQLAALPPTVDFVLINMHHPPVADVQTHIHMDHNPRPNEIALRDFLTGIAPSFHAQIVVIAGHIHNYERAQVGGVTYLVSGGGGAQPYYVERTKDDLYTDPNFPVFHYLRFQLDGDTLNATMVKIADPTTSPITWQVKDHFSLPKK